MRIPKFIGSLSKLTLLDLSDSGFFGEIPAQLANLSRLQYLDLSGDSNGLYANNLQWLSHLSSITNLHLDNVNLSKAIDWASTLKRLPTLSEFSCESCSLPPSLLSSLSHSNFSTSLEYLDLSNNTMSSSTFSYLINGTGNLQVIILDEANLQVTNGTRNLINDEILEVLAKRARYSLKELHLRGNNISKLSSKVRMFPSLSLLDASSNRISGSISEILQYLPTSLTNLDLSSNFLNDVISDAHFSKFSQLQELYLSNNIRLTINFSKTWVPPFQLDTLHLSSCKVGPNFPNWILTQKRLEDLDISSSMISGAIPDAFWYIFSQSYSLNISHNKINSKISQPNLSPLLLPLSHQIDLSSNSFYGPIPHFMFNASILDLSQNKFSSFAPLDPTLMSPNMMVINLSGNQLTGSLPNWFCQFDGLAVLNLENNNLSGTIPREIGSLWQLTTLHLSNNNFSGQLPFSMKNCTALGILELENNKFHGAVPCWLGGRLTQLIVLNLRSNEFSGNLPSSLCHLRSLIILDLSDNKLSGKIPNCLHNFSFMSTNKRLGLIYISNYYIYISQSLVLLDHAFVMWKGALADLNGQSLDQRNFINLSGNMFTGEIPIGVIALKELRSLDLSRNYLNGSIPDKIDQLTNLELLRLSSNRLCGEIPESLASLTFLGTLDLSDNNLSGRIPTSTQLQGFNASSYAGNLNLCGDPLPKCPRDEDGRQTLSNKDEGDESFDVQAFLAALGAGFVLGTLHFNRHSRLAFFQLIHNIADWTFVTTSLCKSRIKREINEAADK